MKYVLIYFHDLTSVLVGIKKQTDFELAVASILVKNGKTETDVKARFEVPAADIPPEFYLECLTLNDKNELIFNTSYVIDKHLDLFWTPMRDYLLRSLDVEYIRADEAENKAEKTKITKRKNFLRDLPDFLLRTMAKSKNIKLSLDTRAEDLEPVRVVDTFANLTMSQQLNLRKIFNKECPREAAFKITPFYNIFEIKVVDGGSGYTLEPQLTIECDCPTAFPPMMRTEIEGGSVKSVIVISPGCGYVCQPIVKISAPQNPGGRLAVLTTQVEYKLDNVNHGLPI